MWFSCSYPEVDMLNLPKLWRTTWVRYIKSFNHEALSSLSLHLLKNGKLWNVYRLYDDLINVFTVPVKLTEFPKDIISQLSVQSSQHSVCSIPVRSRLHTRSSPALTISGMRIAVKDMFHIQEIPKLSWKPSVFGAVPGDNKYCSSNLMTD